MSKSDQGSVWLLDERLPCKTKLEYIATKNNHGSTTNSEEVHQEKRGHISVKTETILCRSASLENESSGKKTELKLKLEPANQTPKKQPRRKREKYLPHTVPLVLPPCRICGKAASGIHYGVNSCEACKVFKQNWLCFMYGDLYVTYKVKLTNKMIFSYNIISCML